MSLENVREVYGICLIRVRHAGWVIMTAGDVARELQERF